MLRLGIVGLPNVGKSTLFNALTSSKAAAAENYPFCTVEPNVGVVEVPDPRLERLNEPRIRQESPGGGRVRGHRGSRQGRSEEHTSELQSRLHLVCRLLLEKKKT